MLNLAILSTIPDHRRGQGRLFDLPHVLLCSILAVLAGADSYRSVYRFIDTRWEWLRQHTGLHWRQRACYTGLYHSAWYRCGSLGAGFTRARCTIDGFFR